MRAKRSRLKVYFMVKCGLIVADDGSYKIFTSIQCLKRSSVNFFHFAQSTGIITLLDS